MIQKREKIAFDLGYRVVDNVVVNIYTGAKLADHIGSSGFRVFCFRLNKKSKTVSVHTLAGFEIFGEKIYDRKFRVSHKDNNKLNNNKENFELIKWCGWRNIDFTGQRFGRLVAISRARNEAQKSTYYFCRCDCGKEPIVTHSNLKSGSAKSCGCLQKDIISARSLKDPAVTVANRVLNYYKKNAKSRSLEWSLSKEEFEKLIFDKCYYCGSDTSMSKIHYSKHKANKTEVPYNGIDRKNNEQGYNTGNCVTCCLHCNQSKNRFTFEEFKEWALRLADNLRNMK